MTEKPNYYAIIPANVRYSSLKPNAKLLYGEITALSSKLGYCFASNNYFAELYGVSKNTVSRWLSDLKKLGFITIKIERNTNKEIVKRIIGIDKKVDNPIDKIVKENNTSNNTTSNKLDMGVVCSMQYHDSHGLVLPCGFYLYPRSSTGSKTPLRLSNSVGVIDAGYRGNLIACFDNIDSSGNCYQVKAGDRLVQICASNLIYPISVEIVSTVGDLELDANCINTRGTGGFGSTGN